MGKKILIIEDEAELVKLIELRLKASNFEVISALDGEEGLKKAQSENPDLILLDIVMPKIDGYMVCRHLKDDPKTQRIPIIIITASGGKNLQQRSRDAGADGLVIKPFEAEDLLSKISNFVKA